MPKIEWRPAARADLASIISFIADRNADAAQALKDDIETKIARLPEMPRSHRVGRITRTREMVVRPNYIVIYSEQDGQVSVLRILHAAQQWP